MREEYRIPRITKERADTLDTLAEKLEGVDARRFPETVRALNAAPRPGVTFNPTIRRRPPDERACDRQGQLGPNLSISRPTKPMP